MQHKNTVQYSDQMNCKDCGQTWDVNDSNPPPCHPPRNRQPEYRVTWCIDVGADSPEEAAKYVWQRYFHHGHSATIFEVQQHDEPDSEMIDVESKV